MNSLPDRFHIGTQRAGSTYLYNLLKEHPDISLSSFQEVNYYTKNFRRGKNWYCETFSANGVPIDTSPVYFRKGDVVAPRIKEVLPDADPRFLLIIRNPIDYLYSLYHMHLNIRHFKKRPDEFPTIPSSFIEFVDRYPHYLDYGRYAETLEENWLTVYAVSRFKIVLFEDFISNTDEALSEILDFFGLRQMKLATVAASKNKMLRSSLLFVLKNKIVKNQGLKKLLKKSRLFNLAYDRLLTANPPKLIPSQRNLLKELLSDDVVRLEKIIGHPLRPWHDFYHITQH